MEKRSTKLCGNIFLEFESKYNREFVFSKDDSKLSPEYLAAFDVVIFYTTGDLTKKNLTASRQ